MKRAEKFFGPVSAPDKQPQGDKERLMLARGAVRCRSGHRDADSTCCSSASQGQKHVSRRYESNRTLDLLVQVRLSTPRLSGWREALRLTEGSRRGQCGTNQHGVHPASRPEYRVVLIQRPQRRHSQVCSSTTSGRRLYSLQISGVVPGVQQAE